MKKPNPIKASKINRAIKKHNETQSDTFAIPQEYPPNQDSQKTIADVSKKLDDMIASAESNLTAIRELVLKLCGDGVPVTLGTEPSIDPVQLPIVDSLDSKVNYLRDLNIKIAVKIMRIEDALGMPLSVPSFIE